VTSKVRRTTSSPDRRKGLDIMRSSEKGQAWGRGTFHSYTTIFDQKTETALAAGRRSLELSRSTLSSGEGKIRQAQGNREHSWNIFNRGRGDACRSPRGAVEKGPGNGKKTNASVSSGSRTGLRIRQRARTRTGHPRQLLERLTFGACASKREKVAGVLRRRLSRPIL